MDRYFPCVVFVKHFENLLVLRSIQVELIVLPKLLGVVFAQEPYLFVVSILIFIGHETRAHFWIFHFV